MEPRGSLLIPPDFNVGLTDWERSKRLRKGVFDVLELEPHGSASEQLPEGLLREDGGGGGGGSQVAVHPSEVNPHSQQQQQHSGQNHLARYQQPMSEGDLDVLRRKLERLLPSTPEEEEGGSSSSAAF